MDGIYFWSDSHWGHKRIIELSNRPDSSVEAMDERMIAAWNRTVSYDGVVYFLGDFSFYNPEKTRRIRSRLNGTIHYIRGNHDKSVDKIKDTFESYSDYKEITIEDQKIILCHYPFAEWNGAHKGSWHLHGHQHGNGPRVAIPRLDVGVDCFPDGPVSYSEVERIMARRIWEPVSHH
jgi:calcineurin-like phosphoesterase family protein